jgi:hypothetical protein
MKDKIMSFFTNHDFGHIGFQTMLSNIFILTPYKATSYNRVP